MRLQILAPLLAAGAATAFTPASTTATDLLAANGLFNLAVNQIESTVQGQAGSCTLSSVAIRREWSVPLNLIQLRSVTDISGRLCQKRTGKLTPMPCFAFSRYQL